MACCAMGPCDDSVENGGKGCYLCDVVAKIQPPEPCPRKVDGRKCRRIKGHSNRCVPYPKKKKQASDVRPGDVRDGAPRLSGMKRRGNLAFEKRQRVGPHR